MHADDFIIQDFVIKQALFVRTLHIVFKTHKNPFSNLLNIIFFKEGLSQKLPSLEITEPV